MTGFDADTYETNFDESPPRQSSSRLLKKTQRKTQKTSWTLAEVIHDISIRIKSFIRKVFLRN